MSFIFPVRCPHAQSESLHAHLVPCCLLFHVRVRSIKGNSHNGLAEHPRMLSFQAPQQLSPPFRVGQRSYLFMYSGWLERDPAVLDRSKKGLGLSDNDIVLGKESFTMNSNWAMQRVISCLPTLVPCPLRAAFGHQYLVSQNRSYNLVLPKPAVQCRASDYEAWTLHFQLQHSQTEYHFLQSATGCQVEVRLGISAFPLWVGFGHVVLPCLKWCASIWITLVWHGADAEL